MAIIKGIHTLDLRALRNLSVVDGDVSIAEVNLTASLATTTITVSKIGFAGAGATLTAEQSSSGTERPIQHPTMLVAIVGLGDFFYPTSEIVDDLSLEGTMSFADLDFGEGKEFDNKFANYFNTVFPIATGIKGSFQLNSLDFANVELLNGDNTGNNTVIVKATPEGILFKTDSTIITDTGSVSYSSLSDFNAANITIPEVIYQPTNAIEFLRKNSSTLEFVPQKFIEPTDDVEQPVTLAMLKVVKDEVATDIPTLVLSDADVDIQKLLVDGGNFLTESGKGKVKTFLDKENPPSIIGLSVFFNDLGGEILNCNLLLATDTGSGIDRAVRYCLPLTDGNDGLLVGMVIGFDTYETSAVYSQLHSVSHYELNGVDGFKIQSSSGNLYVTLDNSLSINNLQDGLKISGSFGSLVADADSITLNDKNVLFETGHFSPLKNGDTFGGAIYFDRTRNIDAWLEKAAESGTNRGQLYGTDFVNTGDCSIVWVDVAYLANSLTGASNPLRTMGYALITCPWGDSQLRGIIYLSENVPDAVLDLFEMKHGWQVDGLVTTAGEQGTQVEALKEGVDFLYGEDPNNNGATYFQGTIRGGEKGEKTYNELLNNPKHKVCKLEFINANLSAVEWYHLQSRGASTAGTSKLAVLNYIGVSNFFSDTVDYIKILSTGEEQEGHVPIISLYGVSMSLSKNNELTTAVSSFDGDLSRRVEDSINLSPLISYTNSTPTTITVGGIEEGSTFNNVSIQSILDDLLHPYVKPEINSITTTPNGGNTYIFEKDETVTITSVSVSITKGTSAVAAVELLDGSNVLSKSTSSDFGSGTVILNKRNDSSNSDLSIVVSDDKTFTARVIDEKGKFSTANRNLTFVYPTYYGVVAENVEINEESIKALIENRTLVKKLWLEGSRVVSYTANNQKMIFISPYTVSKIIDPNSFDITGSFDIQRLLIENATYTVCTARSAATLTAFEVTFRN